MEKFPEKRFSNSHTLAFPTSSAFANLGPVPQLAWEFGRRTCSPGDRPHVLFTTDIYANAKVYWRNVPARVWHFSVGGYPVLKKWLSYRDQRVLDRALRVEELEQFQAIARRITSILLLNPQLDAAYTAVKRHATAFPVEQD